MITYICKYTPVELLTACGAALDAPNAETADFSYAETMIHSNLCAHARQLITAARGADEILLTNCCDSVRRVYDTLEAEQMTSDHGAGGRGKSYLSMMDLPHTDDGCAVQLLKKELLRIRAEYEAYTHRKFDRSVFLRAWDETANAWRDKQRRMNAGRFLALLGARGGDALISLIQSHVDMPLFDLTCGGCRNLPSPPDEAEIMPDDALMTEYASALLSQIPCMRMKEIGSRRALTEQPNLRGIIYNTVKFCDYYSFEYAELAGRTNLPVLKIETDYTSVTEGQLVTRLEAFAEEFTQRTDTLPSENAARAASSSEPEKEADGTPFEEFFVGVDSGSTTTNIVALDRAGKIRASAVVRTGAKAGDAAEKALAEIRRQLGLSEERTKVPGSVARATEPGTLVRICATGYGRDYISYADSTKTEITCHARGAHFMNPAARTVIDIGGQDSKVICLDENGAVSNFIMNDKCAAGTGRFLEMMARTLELSLAEMDALCLKWKNDLTISSTCTVFAESEVISLIAQNKSTADIIHGLDKAVAAKTASMVRRANGTPPYMMTGGVACNPGVAKELEIKLGEKLAITENPDLIGAIGAALFARDE